MSCLQLSPSDTRRSNTFAFQQKCFCNRITQRKAATQNAGLRSLSSVSDAQATGPIVQPLPAAKVKAGGQGSHASALPQSNVPACLGAGVAWHPQSSRTAHQQLLTIRFVLSGWPSMGSCVGLVKPVPLAPAIAARTPHHEGRQFLEPEQAVTPARIGPGGE